MHLGSAVCHWGVGDMSGLRICVLSLPNQEGTKSLIFPHKVPLVGNDRFVQIS